MTDENTEREKGRKSKQCAQSIPHSPIQPNRLFIEILAYSVSFVLSEVDLRNRGSRIWLNGLTQRAVGRYEPHVTHWEPVTDSLVSNALNDFD